MKTSQNAKQVIVLITDGKFEREVHAFDSARQARSQGIEIFAVGIGQVDPSQLKQMTASDDRVFMHSTFNQLLAHVNKLKVAQFECFETFTDFCAIETSENRPCEQYCLNRADSHTCACYQNFYLATDLKSCLPLPTNEKSLIQHSEESNKKIVSITIGTVLISVVCLAVLLIIIKRLRNGCSHSEGRFFEYE